MRPISLLPILCLALHLSTGWALPVSIPPGSTAPPGNVAKGSDPILPSSTHTFARRGRDDYYIERRTSHSSRTRGRDRDGDREERPPVFVRHVRVRGSSVQPEERDRDYGGRSTMRSANPPLSGFRRMSMDAGVRRPIIVDPPSPVERDFDLPDSRPPLSRAWRGSQPAGGRRASAASGERPTFGRGVHVRTGLDNYDDDGYHRQDQEAFQQAHRKMQAEAARAQREAEDEAAKARADAHAAFEQAQRVRVPEYVPPPQGPRRADTMREAYSGRPRGPSMAGQRPAFAPRPPSHHAPAFDSSDDETEIQDGSLPHHANWVPPREHHRANEAAGTREREASWRERTEDRKGPSLRRTGRGGEDRLAQEAERRRRQEEDENAAREKQRVRDDARRARELREQQLKEEEEQAAADRRRIRRERERRKEADERERRDRKWREDQDRLRQQREDEEEALRKRQARRLAKEKEAREAREAEEELERQRRAKAARAPKPPTEQDLRRERKQKEAEKREAARIKKDQERIQQAAKERLGKQSPPQPAPGEKSREKRPADPRFPAPEHRTPEDDARIERERQAAREAAAKREQDEAIKQGLKDKEQKQKHEHKQEQRNDAALAPEWERREERKLHLPKNEDSYRDAALGAYQRTKDEYDKWDALPESEKQRKPLTWDMFPWPVIVPVGTITPADVNAPKVAEFFKRKRNEMSASTYKSYRFTMLKTLAPDKMTTRLKYSLPEQKRVITEAVTQVASGLNDVKHETEEDKEKRQAEEAAHETLEKLRRQAAAGGASHSNPFGGPSRASTFHGTPRYEERRPRRQDTWGNSHGGSGYK